MEKLIACVREHPCLWNPQHPEYSDVHTRGHAWQEVITQLNDKSIPNIKAARTEWRKLRDNHRDALKRAKLGQNKLLPAHITTWKYAKQMQFLEPHMKYRITENIEMEPTTPVLSKTSEQDVSTTDNVEHMKKDTIKRSCTDITEAPPSKIPAEDNSDALESFFSCLLKSTREMPPWMQTQVKKKIFAVIIEAEENLSAQDRHLSVEYEMDYVIENKIKREKFDDT